MEKESKKVKRRLLDQFNAGPSSELKKSKTTTEATVTSETPPATAGTLQPGKRKVSLVNHKRKLQKQQKVVLRKSDGNNNAVIHDSGKFESGLKSRSRPKSQSNQIRTNLVPAEKKVCSVKTIVPIIQTRAMKAKVSKVNSEEEETFNNIDKLTSSEISDGDSVIDDHTHVINDGVELSVMGSDIDTDFPEVDETDEPG